MEYTTKDFEAYYNGDDVNFDINAAENDPKFIYKLLKYTISIKKDKNQAKKYYEDYFCNIIKGDYKTIKLLLEYFKDDQEFICAIGNNYFSTEPSNNVECFEIAILISEALKNYPNEITRAEFALKANSFYIKETSIISKAKEQKNEPNYGFGFFLVQKNYKENPTILSYIAKNMVIDILYQNQKNNLKALEDFFHKKYKGPEEIKNPNNFLLSIIRSYDSPLADYITPRIPKGFFNFLNDHITLIKNRWQNYIDENNRRKRICIEKYCYQFDENHRAIFENSGNFYGIFDIFSEIVTKLQLNEIFDIEITQSLPPNPNMSEDEKLFRNTLEYLFAQAFKDDTFDPGLFAFLEFDNQAQVVSIFDADLMYGEKPPKRS